MSYKKVVISEFGDIRVPKELKLHKKSPLAYITINSVAGIVVYKGKMDMYSLSEFVDQNMAGENWIKLTSFKSIQTISMFQKQDRIAVAGISQKGNKASLTLSVHPILDY